LLPASRAEVKPNSLFSDHAVLQQGCAVPVWGTAKDGERITVAFGGQKVSTTATDGKWRVRLEPLAAGGPFTMVISGENTVTISDLLVGEVWICSGQSNMERVLGPQEGMKPNANWEREVAAANYPQIRHFTVAKKTAFAPVDSIAGHWVVCSPQTVSDFTAVGYFFGRDLLQAGHGPVGLIHSSWGGTPAEAWTGMQTLRKMPDFALSIAELGNAAAELKAGTYNYLQKTAVWYAAHDAGSTQTPAWNASDLDVSSWKPQNLPGFWEEAGLADFDGVVWFRKTFDLPATWAGGEVELHLGAIDDDDTTWVNGVQVGATAGWEVLRVYRVPATVLKPGRNVIAVRVLDTGGGGGLWGGKDMNLRLVPGGNREPASLSLTGRWLRKVSISFADTPRPPVNYADNPGTPGSLYNGMIAPLVPYAIRGVIWYQGEANVGREKQYRTFFFVQIAPYKDMTPLIREAQLLTWQRTPNTAMAVTIDCGDADNIHPPHKQPVGARLALAARALTYGEKLEYSGPVFDSMQIEGDRSVLRFTHLGGGLVAKDGALTGFTVAGADRIFHPANAGIEGDTVIVSAATVPRPVAVRYGWANVPVGNLFNRAGLPASPFRTDVD
jgi:sialate O-acetylesterase